VCPTLLLLVAFSGGPQSGLSGHPVFGALYNAWAVPQGAGFSRALERGSEELFS